MQLQINIVQYDQAAQIILTRNLKTYQNWHQCPMTHELEFVEHAGESVSVWKSGPVRFFSQISTDRNRNRLPIMARPQITGPDRK